jgi:hypothetical protein
MSAVAERSRAPAGVSAPWHPATPHFGVRISVWMLSRLASQLPPSVAVPSVPAEDSPLAESDEEPLPSPPQARRNMGAAVTNMSKSGRREIFFIEIRFGCKSIAPGRDAS